MVVADLGLDNRVLGVCRPGGRLLWFSLSSGTRFCRGGLGRSGGGGAEKVCIFDEVGRGCDDGDCCHGFFWVVMGCSDGEESGFEEDSLFCAVVFASGNGICIWGFEGGCSCGGGLRGGVEEMATSIVSVRLILRSP